MDFLKKHIEKIAFLFLLAGLAFSVVLVMSFQAGVPGVMPAPGPTPDQELDVEVERYDQKLARITQEPRILEGTMDTFTPEERVISRNPERPILIPADAEVCPYTGFVQEAGPQDSSGDGIPDHVKLDWGLDPMSATDAFQSLDGTGFTAHYQYHAGYDPLDPEDRPPHIDYLRLEDVEERSIDFELRGTAQLAPNVHTLQLRWRYPGEDRWESEYVRVGNRFGRNDEFLAVDYVEEHEMVDNRRVDRTHVHIRSGRHTLRLYREGEGRRGRISERTATLALYMGPEWQERVRVDQSFALDNKTYNVVDIHTDSVVILAEDEEDPLTIRAVTADEMEEAEPPEPETPSYDNDVDPDERGFEHMMMPM